MAGKAGSYHKALTIITFGKMIFLFIIKHLFVSVHIFSFNNFQYSNNFFLCFFLAFCFYFFCLSRKFMAKMLMNLLLAWGFFSNWFIVIMKKCVFILKYWHLSRKFKINSAQTGVKVELLNWNMPSIIYFAKN